VLRDGSLVQAYRNRAQSRVKEKYDWDYVVDRYEQLFAQMAGKTTSSPRPYDGEPAPVSAEKSFSRSASA
jgi:hypothetical protein